MKSKLNREMGQSGVLDAEDMLNRHFEFLGWGDPGSGLWVICTEEAKCYETKEHAASRANEIRNLPITQFGDLQLRIDTFGAGEENESCTTQNVAELLKIMNPNSLLGRTGNFYMNLWPLPHAIHKEEDCWNNYRQWFLISREEYISRVRSERFPIVRRVIDWNQPRLVVLVSEEWDRFIGTGAMKKKVDFESPRGAGVQLFQPNWIVANHPGRMKGSAVSEWCKAIVSGRALLVGEESP